MKPITVVIAEDLPAQRTFLKRVISSTPPFELVGAVANGLALVDLVTTKQPNIIITDLDMPEYNGIDAIKRLKQLGCDSKILVYSSAARENRRTLLALEYGALDILDKPSIDDKDSYQQAINSITQKLQQFVGLTRKQQQPLAIKAVTQLSTPPMVSKRFIAIGGSMGSIQVLPTIFKHFDKFTQSSILVTQHMDARFMDGFHTWLANNSPVPVKLATHGEIVRKNMVYVAPAAGHMLLVNDRICIDNSGLIHGCKPAVDPMFSSLAPVADQTCATILSGMGKDGAQGLLTLRQAGGLTIAQNEQSCAVYSMPKEAEKLEAVQYRGDPESIGLWLGRMSRTV